MHSLDDSKYLQVLRNKVIVFDGAMGTSLQIKGLSGSACGDENTEGCIDCLNLSCPDDVEQVHREFLQAGVDVIETNTFRSNRITLAEYGLADHTVGINARGAEIARKVADEFSTEEHPRFVAGSVGPTGKLPSLNDPEMSDILFEDLVEIFKEQGEGLLKGGVDLFLIETSQDILEVKAAIAGLQAAMKVVGREVPIQAQVTLDTTGHMLLGTDIEAVLTILEGLPITTIGLNCSTGPQHMRQSIRYLGENATMPISCIPNAGLPINVDGQAVYPLEPAPYAEIMTEFVEKYGVNVVGGCCGTTPEHMQLLVEKLRARDQSMPQGVISPRLASGVSSMMMVQQPPPFLVGERLNTQGSRKFKELLMNGDLEEISKIARQQVDNGAHGLDVCVALTERPDEADLMRQVIKTISPIVNVPLIIDTTELDVLEIGLQTAPGRCLINSTNLESGEEKANQIFALAKKYNAAVITLTIDEQGMAKTVDKKIEVAKRIYDIAVNRHGLNPHDVVFDALTFTLATGDPEISGLAIETLEGIRKIKEELPGALTILGVSNVSFGLKSAARAVINSVMLYHAVDAGLEMAIVNPAHIIPYAEIAENEKHLAEDLIFNRSPDALQNLIEHYESAGGTLAARKDNKAEALKQMTAEERLQFRIIQRIKEDVEADIDEIIERDTQRRRHDVAVEVLNTVLLPAMKEVGDRFGSGELILPFVLQSAEVMKKSVGHLETYLERKEGTSKGKIVIATVYGDVHDIGKNLVKTILVNNGYEVVDLGKQTPAETIISKAIEIEADAIGLSALLVSTSKQMPLIVNELHTRSSRIPVLIGGAAINRKFGRRILLTEQEQIYEAGVFYCKDAFEGLSVMDQLVDEEQRSLLIEKIRTESQRELDRAAKAAAGNAGNDQQNEKSRRSNVKPAPNVPSGVEWGPKVVKDMPLDAVFGSISKTELFRLSWGGRNTQGAAWKKLEKEFEERLEMMRRKAISDNWLKPQAVYGYWPVQSEGDDVLIYDPDSVRAGSPQVIERFTFPRQPHGEFLSLADYFLPVGSERMDVAAFHVVTVGHEATQRFDKLQKAEHYTEAYYTHGLAVQMAEATAEYIHHHIRRDLGLKAGQGKRYSWGYPSIPELEDHEKVFRLLPAPSALGMSLTSAYQLIPEQSTAAIILHHPDAKYFIIGESRIDQLIRASQ
jgi:5-methyltetrahydrofolate--homocysteine methyltransferase